MRRLLLALALICGLAAPAAAQLGTQANPMATVAPTIVATSSFVMTGSTAAYSLGDLVANSATAANVTPLAFNLCATPGGRATIRSIHGLVTDMSLTNFGFTLWLYSQPPVVVNGDHAAWSTGSAGFLESIMLGSAYRFSDGIAAVGYPNSAGSELHVRCATNSQTIYGLLSNASAQVTVPSGGGTISVTLEATPN